MLAALGVPMSDEYFQKAARLIGLKPIFEFDGEEIHVVLLVNSPPLIAKWWRGKQVHIIGADVDGNFFLRHSDGSVRYWEHSKNSEKVVAKSVKEFVNGLREDINDSLSWWKKQENAKAT